MGAPVQSVHYLLTRLSHIAIYMIYVIGMQSILQTFENAVKISFL